MNSSSCTDPDAQVFLAHILPALVQSTFRPDDIAVMARGNTGVMDSALRVEPVSRHDTVFYIPIARKRSPLAVAEAALVVVVVALGRCSPDRDRLKDFFPHSA